MAMARFCKEAWTPSVPPMNENQPGFVFSFRPIVLCFKFFGFDIQWGNQQPTNCSLVNIFYRLIWLLINIVAFDYSIYRIYKTLVYGVELHVKSNFVITFATIAVQISATYGSLALAAWRDGGQLAESLRMIEARMPITKEMLKKIRIASITVAVGATILVRTKKNPSRLVRHGMERASTT